MRLICAVALVAVFIAACGGAARTTPVGRALPPAPPPVNPCSVLTRHQVSVAFRVAAPPTARRIGAACSYHQRHYTLTVTVGVATAANRDSLEHPIASATRLDGPGYAGTATDYIREAQTGVALVKGRILLMLVLTDTKGHRRSLHRAAIALGRDAARRL
jgi:hypothetical protein